MSRDSSHWSSAAGRRVERVGPIEPEPLTRLIRPLVLVLVFGFVLVRVRVNRAVAVRVRMLVPGGLLVLVLMVVIAVPVLVRVLHAVRVPVRVLVLVGHEQGFGWPGVAALQAGSYPRRAVREAR